MKNRDDHPELPFGDDKPPAFRHDDPVTSKDAGKRARKDNPVGRFKLFGRGGNQTYQAKLLQLYGNIKIHNKGDYIPELDGPLIPPPRDYTDIEAAAAIRKEGARHANMESARRRGSDLRAAGFIVDTKTPRSNAGSPDKAMACTITEAGWNALRLLRDTGRSWA